MWVNGWKSIQSTFHRMCEKSGSSFRNMENPKCLRCDDIVLDRLRESTRDITFYECRVCHRHYALKLGGILTYRWLHPVSLPLYEILFHQNPYPMIPYIARKFIKDIETDRLSAMLNEIELELRQPTQPVREILGNPQPEELCREFLERFIFEVTSSRQ